VAFALWALRPSLTVPGRGLAVSAVLVAVSLPALALRVRRGRPRRPGPPARPPLAASHSGGCTR